VARQEGFALTIRTADCAPVALGSPEGVYGAVHVGWRGLVAGVLARAVERARALGATTLSAGLGPTIGPCCYDFSADDLDRVEAAIGHRTRSRSTAGGASLDLPGAVALQLADAGVVLTDAVGECTVCAPGYFSYRGRADAARQAVYVWREG
jgi:copper oxidase (laccase) domain-containing protein